MNEKLKTIEEWLSLSLNELDDVLLELADQGFDSYLLMKLRSRLIRATYWSDRLLAELYHRNKSDRKNEERRRHFHVERRRENERDRGYR